MNVLKKIIDYLLSEKFFDKKKLEINDFDRKFKNILNLINNKAPFKIIYNKTEMKKLF